MLAGDAARQILGQNPDGCQDLESCVVKNVQQYLSAVARATSAGNGQGSRSLR